MEKKILDIASNHYKYLLNLENVISVGMGYKYINGNKTEELCIHVGVDRKIEERFISKNNIIPKTYMGIKTDVVNIGKLNFFNQTTFNDDSNLSSKIRPLKGGYAIETELSEGTIGCIVSKQMRGKKTFFILSNNHVLTARENLNIGAPIFQPEEDENNENFVANLTTYVPFNYDDGSDDPLVNYVDCAIARINNSQLASNKIAIIGEIKGVSEPKLGLQIKKVGKSTGYTEGEIITIGQTVSSKIDEEKSVIFKNLIVANLKSSFGDSGSVIVNENNEVVGLLIGGDIAEETSTFSNIQEVLKRLKVDIYTG